MITIKSNVYGEAEKRAINRVFEESVKMFINKYCAPSVSCDVCPYRHLCYDLTKARDYAYKLANGGDRK